MPGTYHLDCWKKLKPDSEAKGWSAKYDSTKADSTKCGYEDCPFAGQVTKGQLIYWSRQSVKAGPEDIDSGLPEGSPEAATDVAKSLAALVLPVIEPRLRKLESRPAVDIDALVNEIRASMGEPTRIEVVTPDRPEPLDVGIVHKQFPTLLQVLSCPAINVWCPGPAGSGKTSAAHKAAEALGLEFYYIGAVTDPYQLLGFNDAHGNYVPTPFFKAWTGGEKGNGAVFLFDDTDGSDPSALVALNALLANGVAAFPHGMFPRHPKTRVMATANTWGHGATQDYVGRSKIDGATLDRFVFLAWDYDLDLEKAMTQSPEWAKRVQAVRARVREKQVRVLITPRATVFGAQLLATGMPQDQVEAIVLRKGMTDEQWQAVK